MTPPQRQRRYPSRPPAPEPAAGERRNPERMFVVGGDGGDRANLDLVTLIVARADPPPSATPEQTALLRLCTAPLSVAELSAYLSLPFSVVTVVLTQMLADELVEAHKPLVRQSVADRSLLEAVMHGLQKL
ncbi:hypothetical protein Stsp02_17620 [Streptomyces sp. NBRC 14336]|uniref:DUF742 domain-containing protein n=1 Tax=unclassified Streptomyces TaxID=2593676 RepID=UPI00202FF3EB|nr:MULTISPECIES: DUF742 domain-containing protein [unclassified Streptomyces]MCM1975496.1 DUF742 domain-containing protein [Streptomyces sp. G1]WBO76936.1 DUF742 domain-containing protein [Streptomyces sp. SBE_14.2]GLW46100.1 hypothetical protein Stsp02_17620 [Streptomyces sp. NBRC 14336]